MTPPDRSPLEFLCSACDILGLEWPGAAVELPEGGDVRLVFAIAPQLLLSIGHDAQARRYVSEAQFEAARGRSAKAVALLALEANHLREPGGACFSMDPATGCLVLRLVASARGANVAEFCEGVASLVLMALDWRRMIDAPPPAVTDSLAITTWS